MKNTQQLLNELHSFYKELTIRIDYSYQLDEENKCTPYLLVMFGKDLGHHFDIGFIHKESGKFKLETELNIEDDIKEYYELFEGGFEDNIDDCLNRMINNIKKYKK